MSDDPGLLKIEYDAFQSDGSHMTDIHDSLVQINTVLMNQVQTITAGGGGGLWAGQSAATFANRLAEAAQAMRRVLQQLQAGCDSVPQIATIVQDADSRGSSLFNAST